MDISEEELQRFIEQRQNLVKENKECEEIKKKLKNNEIKDLEILWHTNYNHIDFSLQKDQIDDNTISNGWTIIESIDVDTLLNSMAVTDKEIYSKVILFNPDANDRQLCEIIKFWLREEKLIPPTVIAKPDIEGINKIYLLDGKHRFNVAYYFGIERLPIIVLNNHLDEVKRLLNL
jgi:hypothetical protein